MFFCFILTAMATATGGSCQTIKVLTTTNNIDKFADGSGARLVSNDQQQPAELAEVSICFRFLLSFVTNAIK